MRRKKITNLIKFTIDIDFEIALCLSSIAIYPGSSIALVGGNEIAVARLLVQAVPVPVVNIPTTSLGKMGQRIFWNDVMRGCSKI
jgi:hypothetical protein